MAKEPYAVTESADGSSCDQKAVLLDLKLYKNVSRKWVSCFCVGHYAAKYIHHKIKGMNSKSSLAINPNLQPGNPVFKLVKEKQAILLLSNTM